MMEVLAVMNVGSTPVKSNEYSEECTVVQMGSDMYFGASWLPRRCNWRIVGTSPEGHEEACATTDRRRGSRPLLGAGVLNRGSVA